MLYKGRSIEVWLYIIYQHFIFRIDYIYKLLIIGLWLFIEVLLYIY